MGDRRFRDPNDHGQIAYTQLFLGQRVQDLGAGWIAQGVECVGQSHHRLVRPHPPLDCADGFGVDGVNVDCARDSCFDDHGGSHENMFKYYTMTIPGDRRAVKEAELRPSANSHDGIDF